MPRRHTSRRVSRLFRRSGAVILGLVALRSVGALRLWLTTGGAHGQGAAGQGGGIPLTQPGQTPAYTADDARAWVATHGFPGGNTTTGKPFTIQTVEFITREQAEALTHGQSLEGQVAPGDMVCCVELIGPFDGAGVHAAPGRRHDPSAYVEYHGTMILDAHTGLLLEWGFDQ